MHRDDALRKISALLLKTIKNGATQAESEAAFAKAAAIMDEYQISNDDLSEPVSEFGVGDFFHGKSLSISQITALVVVQSAFPVKVLVVRRRGSGTVKVFGDAVSCQSAAWAFQFLTATFADLWTRYKPPGRSAEIRESYFRGLAIGMLLRINGKRDRRNKKHPGSGIVLASRREILNAAFDEKFGKTKSAKLQIQRQHHSHAAADALAVGKLDGDQINLARPIDRQTDRSITSV